MAVTFMPVLRIAQVVFTIVGLGLSAYGMRLMG